MMVLTRIGAANSKAAERDDVACVEALGSGQTSQTRGGEPRSLIICVSTDESEAERIQKIYGQN